MLSIHEIRRRAPLHYWAKADNARYVAHMLSQCLTDEVKLAAKEGSQYGGTPSIAVGECFLREMAIAIELIIKAVIARKIEVGVNAQHVVAVRATHDVVSLWKDASLPELVVDDKLRLLRVKQLLLWSSRYAAPRKDEQFQAENEAEEKIRPQVAGKKIRIQKPLTFGWEDFDRIYKIAMAEFSILYAN